MDLSFTPIPDESGPPAGVFIIAFETTGHICRADENRRALAGEFHQRTRDLLDVVGYVASTTFGPRAENGALESFRERLVSLARVHDLMSHVAGERLTLLELVYAELGGHAAKCRTRLEIHGPDVRLSTEQVQALAIVLHELSSNAAKHGALCVPGGRLSVTWETWLADHGRKVVLTWKESGVPLRVASLRGGCGCVLMENVLRTSLRAETQMRLETDGVWYRIELPLDGMAGR